MKMALHSSSCICRAGWLFNISSNDGENFLKSITPVCVCEAETKPSWEAKWEKSEGEKRRKFGEKSAYVLIFKYFAFFFSSFFSLLITCINIEENKKIFLPLPAKRGWPWKYITRWDTPFFSFLANSLAYLGLRKRTRQGLGFVSRRGKKISRSFYGIRLPLPLPSPQPAHTQLFMNERLGSYHKKSKQFSDTPIPSPTSPILPHSTSAPVARV